MKCADPWDVTRQACPFNINLTATRCSSNGKVTTTTTTTTTRTAAAIAELIDRIATRRLTCDDPATDLLPDHAAGVLDYVLMQRRVPHIVLRADAEDALALVALLRQQTDELEHRTIRLARAAGLTWSRIAHLRGKHSPQAAEQLYQRLAAVVAGGPRQVAQGREHSQSRRRATATTPGTAGHRKVHMDDETWERFGRLTVQAGTSRSAVLREETRNWIRRRERSLGREQGPGRTAAGASEGPRDVLWAKRIRAEAIKTGEALARVEVPAVAAESATWVAEVLHDSDAPATWLPMALALVYKELTGLGLADRELEGNQQIAALPDELVARLAAIAHAWDEVTREPQAPTSRSGRRPSETPARRRSA